MGKPAFDRFSDISKVSKYIGADRHSRGGRVKYPCKVEDMNNKLATLEDCSPVDGLKNISYRHHFIVRTSLDEAGKETEIVLNHKTQLKVFCNKHNFLFNSIGRYLFGRSLKCSFITCPHCDKEAGYTSRPYHTTRSVSTAIAKVNHFSFKVDLQGLDEDDLVTVKTSLPLVCTKIMENGKECGFPVHHTVGNILHALGKPGFLRCQGPCDSKSKGKARRRSIDSVKKQLEEAREGTWHLDEESYKKMSGPVHVIHVRCGKPSFRLLDQVIKFPKKTRRKKDTDKDCPYCNPKSARRLLQADPAQYSHWMKHVTNEEIEYVSGSVAPDDRTRIPLRVKCLVCSSLFYAFENKILRNRFNCCTVCHDSFIHRQRAWDVEEAKEIVARRGYILHDDPLSYTAAADIRQSDGTSANFENILCLLRNLPARADGYGLLQEICLDSSNTGNPYSQEDKEFIRDCHTKNRPKTFICQQLKRTYGSVSQKCRKMGLRFNEYEHFKRRINVKDDFFSVPNITNSYWAGLFAADASISKEISVELKTIDENVLQQLMCDIGHGGVLSYRTMKNMDGRGVYAAVRFRSRQMKENLESIFNITARKSKTIAPPKLVESSTILGFIAGLLEGDGTISITGRGELRASLMTASESMANWLKEQIEAHIKIPAMIRSLSQGRNGIKEIRFHGENAMVFLFTLTKTVSGHMCRKWRVFEQYQEIRRQSDRLA